MSSRRKFLVGSQFGKETTGESQAAAGANNICQFAGAHIKMLFYCFDGRSGTSKKQNTHGASGIREKRTELPTAIHAQCMLSEE